MKLGGTMWRGSGKNPWNRSLFTRRYYVSLFFIFCICRTLEESFGGVSLIIGPIGGSGMYRLHFFPKCSLCLLAFPVLPTLSLRGLLGLGYCSFLIQQLEARWTKNFDNNQKQKPECWQLKQGLSTCHEKYTWQVDCRVEHRRLLPQSVHYTACTFRMHY